MITVQEVLVKESWDESDIKVLLANVSRLPIPVLVKLGLAPSPKAEKPIEAVKEPVKVETPVVEPSPKETPKPRGRRISKK